MKYLKKSLKEVINEIPRSAKETCYGQPTLGCYGTVSIYNATGKDSIAGKGEESITPVRGLDPRKWLWTMSCDCLYRKYYVRKWRNPKDFGGKPSRAREMKWRGFCGI